MIQLSDVQIFLQIVSTGSFSAAARVLKTPKSSVTRQIERLERTVGRALLHRTARAVTLTEAGRAFLPHARRLLNDGVEAENVLRCAAQSAHGRLSISTTGPFARAFLVPHLPAFLERHPNVEVAMWLTSVRMEVGTGEGQVDIAIRMRSAAGPDLASRKLGEIDFWLVASPAYLAALGSPAGPDDLKDHRFIEIGPPNKAHHVELHRGHEVATIRYTPRLHLDDPEAVCIAAEGGAGLALLPSFVAVAAVARGTLVRVMPDWAPTRVPILVLYRTDVAPPVRVRAYVDHLFDTVGASEPWRSGDARASPV